MKQDRISEQELWAGIFLCLKERPMTMTEMSVRTTSFKDAASVGRIAVRIEGLIKSDIVVPMMTKGCLFFRLNEIKEKKVI